MGDAHLGNDDNGAGSSDRCAGGCKGPFTNTTDPETGAFVRICVCGGKMMG